jgi:multidrug efflux pump subunit AcrA (membrane-fusion protein)
MVDEGLFLRAPATTPGRPAVLLEWHVGEGEALREGQPLAQLLDSSGCTTLTSPFNGRLVERWVDEGAPVAEGQRLARLEHVGGPEGSG